MKAITIGRLPGNTIVLENPKVSRNHAKITLNDTGTYEIIDLGSLHGTYVNGRKVKGSMPVTPRDRIVLANQTLQGDWTKAFDSIPNPEKTEPKIIIETQPEKPNVAPPDSVLYNFGKNAESFFGEWSQTLKRAAEELKTLVRLQSHGHDTRRYSEDVFDLSLERYNFLCTQMTQLLSKMESDNATFQQQYDDDMKKLEITYQYRMGNSRSETELAAGLREVDERRQQLRNGYDSIRREMASVINNTIQDFYAGNPPLFPNRLELAPSNSDVWNVTPKQNDEAQNTFYIGETTHQFNFWGERVELKKREYLKALCGGNVIFKYSKKNRQTCFDTVNALICRMLSCTTKGEMRLVMVDLNEMEGTCATFKKLNKGVFEIISRYDDFLHTLDSLASRTENIIQNLLQDDMANIADYNRGKSEKVAYTILVLKDIPAGYGNELGNKLSNIMRNGPRAGVSVMALVDEDEANRNEETLKMYRLLQKSASTAQCALCDLTSPDNDDEQHKSATAAHYDAFPRSVMSAIVEKVNQAMEIKQETILRFNEYMLPEKQWWTGQSANRIDLPFGLSNDMKTTALQITQESGQNSAVVIGIPGSGKSVFLHTIIASAITHYSPKELQLYLLDFSGVEFNVYANHKLPHARVIAPEAEREFGLSILREVYEEGTRRMDLCRENGVTNIVELKRVNPDLVVPRLLVIIDEFQKIFEIENDNISKEANSKIHAIIQEYRKFGINLILATQKLPAKSIVPYDLIANRVVFKSEPNDFSNLINWPRMIPAPRMLTGTCIYNNESGAEMANMVTRSYFINASKELEELLDRVRAFAEQNPSLNDKHELRTFRSDELPIYAKRICSNRHTTPQDIPREVGVYVGESIAISPCHVYMPLTKESNNNILIIGGDQSVAKGIAYHTLISELTQHTPKSCKMYLLNFMMPDDPMQNLFANDSFNVISDFADIMEMNNEEDVATILDYIIKDVIDARKKDPSLPLEHVYINIFDFQRGRMFDSTGIRNDFESEHAQQLAYILKNGPMVGVFTTLQVDNITNLNRMGYDSQKLFCHRIALQMPEQESDKIVGNSAANKLLVFNRPATKYRALYYNNVYNSTTKFKPYKI